jgi:predicted dehydrogenase/threonine dehydrogenase-like Zn-dependent dehydrogenase
VKVLLQSFQNGEVTIIDAPTPRASANGLLVATHASVISAGTERSLVDFGRAGLIEKARSQPDKVKQVLEKIRTDGLMPTLDAVRAKLQDPIPLGYCSAGVVVEVGARVRGFTPGDRVVTNAPHADHARVPHTLAARIPDNVDFEQAAFTPLGAIALQGIRLAQTTIGETVVVYGLGLIGLLAVQLLRAAGCTVIGIDRNPARLALARQFGATVLDGSTVDVVAQTLSLTDGIGADAVLLTLSTDADEPVNAAAAMSRKRGRVILVGMTGLRLRRDQFYKKEITFQVSCSYGPGRYDPSYEEGAQDYPIGFVRWTEQRNFQAVLQLMSEKRLDTSALITNRIPFESAAQAYSLLSSDANALGIVLQYPEPTPDAAARTVYLKPAATQSAPVQRARVCGIIGAGVFAQRILLPAMTRNGFDVQAIASAGGTSAARMARQFNARTATTDIDSIIDDPAIGTVFILTRNDTHATLALRALAAGKHVFVEKPLALTHDELDQLEAAAHSSSGLLTVGFNRRFAPLAVSLRNELARRAGPASLIFTVNAGALPTDHWTVDTAQGGRIAGEGCHFIDLARALIGAPIVDTHAVSARTRDDLPIDDIATLTLRFGDGSLANGSRSFPKERVEAFVDGRTYMIDSWRQLQRAGASKGLLRAPRNQDKGHNAEMQAWAQAVQAGGPPPISYAELFEVSRTTLDLARAARG